eukprot:scaffold2968_cov321-Pinguiococcus_pyrenoidosus.AAC.4
MAFLLGLRPSCGRAEASRAERGGWLGEGLPGGLGCAVRAGAPPHPYGMRRFEMLPKGSTRLPRSARIH